MTTRDTLLAAIASALSGVASGRVYRTRREQLPTLPAVKTLANAFAAYAGQLAT